MVVPVSNSKEGSWQRQPNLNIIHKTSVQPPLDTEVKGAGLKESQSKREEVVPATHLNNSTRTYDGLQPHSQQQETTDYSQRLNNRLANKHKAQQTNSSPTGPVSKPLEAAKPNIPGYKPLNELINNKPLPVVHAPERRNEEVKVYREKPYPETRLDNKNSHQFQAETKERPEAVRAANGRVDHGYNAPRKVC